MHVRTWYYGNLYPFHGRLMAVLRFKFMMFGNFRDSNFYLNKNIFPSMRTETEILLSSKINCNLGLLQKKGL